jgi:archaellum biogenesis ATPase FlaH
MLDKSRKTIASETVVRANDCLARANRQPSMLFDAFWREGEIALLFGASGTGKSIISFQLADALARGRPIEGFSMLTNRKRVLYVDLDLTDEQFRARYGNARFSRNVFRGRPGQNDDVFSEWLRKVVSEHRINIVVIDSLSMLKRTHDGVREMLLFMRQARRLRDEMGVSILVLADSYPAPDLYPVSESDLKRARILCTVCDSVFAIGLTRYPEGGRYLIQIRSRAPALIWKYENKPDAVIEQGPAGMIGFQFDERFTGEVPEEQRLLICDVHARHEAGESFREIAIALGISKTRAYRLCKRWTPVMGGEQSTVNSEEFEDDDEWDEAAISDSAEIWLEEEGCSNAEVLSEPAASAAGQFDDPSRFELSPDWPPAHAGGSDREPRSIYDLELDYNAYHEPIYVESRDGHTGRPVVWYQKFPEGVRRFQRGHYGIQVERLNGGPFL